MVLVYPQRANQGETLILHEILTGKVLHCLCLKSHNQEFFDVSLGTYMYFIVSTNRNSVFFMSYSTGSVSQADFPVPINRIIANPEENQFLIIRSDETQQEILTKDFSSKSTQPIVKNSYMKYVGPNLVYGMENGEIHIMSGDIPKVIPTPHGTIPLDSTDIVGVTKDGNLFFLDDQSVFASNFGVNSIWSFGSSIIAVSSQFVHYYEIKKYTVHSISDCQPPEPFQANIGSINSSVFFAISNNIFQYNVSQGENSKFTSLPQGAVVEKIISTFAVVSIVYHIGTKERKIITFVTGTKQRDEPGIDAVIGFGGITWFLQEDSVIGIGRKNLSIEEKVRINIGSQHGYTNVLKMNDFIGLYNSSNGTISFILNQKLKTFSIMPGVTVFNWPALCTNDYVYICQKAMPFGDVSLKDFIQVEAKVSSCVWFAWSLFAMIGSSLVKINTKGKVSQFWKTPNESYSIAAVLPSQLVFVTTFETCQPISYNRAVIYDILSDCLPEDVVLSKLLAFIPSKSFDPIYIQDAHPKVAMAVMQKSKPLYINNDVIIAYSKYARFNELYLLSKELKTNPDILLEIAKKAKEFGQFDISRQIYESLGEYIELFELFVILWSSHNLQVLAHKSPLTPCVRMFDLSPIDSEYEPISNLALPTVAPIITEKEFYLYYGEASENQQIFPSAFDEITDFGKTEHPITGSEMEAAQQTISNTQPEPEPEIPAEQIVYAEKPKEEKQLKVELANNQFFDDDPQENTPRIDVKISYDKPKGAPKVIGKFEMGAGTTRKRSSTHKKAFNERDLSLNPSQGRDIADMLKDNNNEENTPFQSSMFADFK